MVGSPRCAMVPRHPIGWRGPLVPSRVCSHTRPTKSRRTQVLAILAPAVPSSAAACPAGRAALVSIRQSSAAAGCRRALRWISPMAWSKRPSSAVEGGHGVQAAAVGLPGHVAGPALRPRSEYRPADRSHRCDRYSVRWAHVRRAGRCAVPLVVGRARDRRSAARLRSLPPRSLALPGARGSGRDQAAAVAVRAVVLAVAVGNPCPGRGAGIGRVAHAGAFPLLLPHSPPCRR